MLPPELSPPVTFNKSHSHQKGSCVQEESQPSARFARASRIRCAHFFFPMRGTALCVAATTIASASGLMQPDLLRTSRPTVSLPVVSEAPKASTSRRQLLSALVGGSAALTMLPAPSLASYALYQSSYDTIQDRKASGDWQKSIGSDKETLQDIQAAIARKRPQNPNKPKKAPQYCAGQTASVTPMYENMCANIGVSKADQSNSMADACKSPMCRREPLFPAHSNCLCLRLLTSPAHRLPLAPQTVT